jgi:hypothetical protein|nr:MAG TPA: hypothetical protein [Caudoviricetes sp.]
MERLTNKREADAQREEYERRLANGYPRNIPEERFLRLAAYEDTRLTPELVRETAELAIWVHDNGIEKIKEWIKADKDGRLVVLPVKPVLTPTISSMLYIIEDGEIYEDSLYEGIVGMSERGETNVIYGTIDALSFEQNDIGKTVFLTCEGAKKALEAMKDE